MFPITARMGNRIADIKSIKGMVQYLSLVRSSMKTIGQYHWSLELMIKLTLVMGMFVT